MNTEELTDEDRDFLDHVTQADDDVDEVTALKRELAEERQRRQELEEEVLDIRDELRGWEETVKDVVATVNDHDARLRGDDPTDPRVGNYYENLTILEKYGRMSVEERETVLEGNPSKLRAVEIFHNWNDWSQAGAIDPSEQLISTLHTRGQYNKLAVKVDLQNATDEDLQNIEVYRAMKQVAKLSVVDPDDVETVTDQNGREHITGGAFEYHEKVNADNSKKFKVLKLVDPDMVTLP